MASCLLSGIGNIGGVSKLPPNGLSFSRSDLHGKCFLRFKPISYETAIGTETSKTLTPKCSISASRPASQPRFIQHKQEAFWFYRFLSIVYDHIINPGHWTEDMGDEALAPADLDDRNLIVVDVGGGTGFTTLGIVKHVDAKNVTILDQSPHQLAKAKEEEGCSQDNNRSF